MIIQGDCLEQMKKLDDNSVDSIVSDPPYGLSAAKNSGKSSSGGFMGSGSTGVAAKNLGFQFIGIELNSEYAKIAMKRIERA